MGKCCGLDAVWYASCDLILSGGLGERSFRSGGWGSPVWVYAHEQKVAKESVVSFLQLVFLLVFRLLRETEAG